MDSSTKSYLIGVGILLVGTLVFFLRPKAEISCWAVDNAQVDSDDEPAATYPGIDKKYKDGVYRGTGQGFVDELVVEVTIKGGRIATVVVVQQTESRPETAVTEIPEQIVQLQTTEGVDVISGATYSSKAIIEAANDALQQALVDNSITAAEDKEHRRKSTTTAKKSLGAQASVSALPVWIIGSYDKAGKPNMMMASWVGVCCSEPPCVMIALRQTRYTYENIMTRKAFTVNIPSVFYAKEAAYFGRASGRDINKLEQTNLNPQKSELVDAPYVSEFPLIIECKLIYSYNVGSHTMLIGEIVDVKADESILDKNGRPDIAKLRPFVFATGDQGFYTIGDNIGNVASLSKG